jgi:hypothetical protein
MDERLSVQTTFADQELLRAFSERTSELEVAQRQLLAFRLESSIRSAYISELQQTTAEALTRADKAEHELRLLRLQYAEMLAATQAASNFAEEQIRLQTLRTIMPAVMAMRKCAGLTNPTH